MTTLDCKIVKTDKRLGIAIGWAVVTHTKSADGSWEPYFDRQSDHIESHAASSAFLKFAEGDRTLLLNHDASQGVKGRCLWMFSMDSDTQAALGLHGDKQGVIIGVKPDDASILDRFGVDLHGFSIAGRGTIEEVSD